MTRFMTKASIALLTLGLALGATACEKKGKTENPDEASSKDNNKDPVAKMEGFQASIQGELDAVMKPINDAEALMNDLGEMPAKYNIDAATMMGMFKASFEGGEVSVSADIEIAADAKAELEATLARVKEIGAELKAMPDTVKAATENIVKVGAEATAYATATLPKLQAKLKTSFNADAKAQVQGQIDSVTTLKGEVEGSIEEAKASVMELPAKATEIGAKMAASFAGGASTGG